MQTTIIGHSKLCQPRDCTERVPEPSRCRGHADSLGPAPQGCQGSPGGVTSDCPFLVASELRGEVQEKHERGQGGAVVQEGSRDRHHTCQGCWKVG